MNHSHSADTAVGGLLQQARQAAGLSLADVASRARLPVHVLQSIEAEDWPRLGAPVFARGHIRSYARELGVQLDESALPQALRTPPAEPLVSRVHVPRYRHVAEHLGRRAVYVVMTVALVVPVWLATRGSDAGDAPTVAPLDVSPGAAERMAASLPREPVVASIAPIPTPAPRPAVVALELAGDSWVQVFGRDGAVIERGLLRAGDRRDLRLDTVGRVVLGNAQAVTLRAGDRPLDLAPYTQANVARFTLSSDGSLAPVAP